MALKGKRVLYISYNGMLDPLGQSQVIPYLRELSREGVEFTLLSFERVAAWTPEGLDRCNKLKQELATDNIEWHWLRYHQRPSMPATVYDVAAGLRYAQKLVRRNRIQMVHARSHIPATIALALKRRFGIHIIFDVRGLMAEEYVDANHWREKSLPFRLTKALERRALGAADGVVTLTERIWPIIKEWPGLRGRTVAHEVIPCCTDLNRFRFDPAERARRRAQLKLEDKFVVVYSGSIGGWYLTEEMADFFAALLRERDGAHFLWLSPSGHDRIENIMRLRGIAPDSFSIHAAASSDVPSYLCASDVGLAFIKPCFSKLASSPTKLAEYLGCGLPIIINAGVGDSDTLVTGEEVGAMVADFNAQEYLRASQRIAELLAEPEKIKRRARAVAEKLFDVHDVGVNRYARLYEAVCTS